MEFHFKVAVMLFLLCLICFFSLEANPSETTRITVISDFSHQSCGIAEHSREFSKALEKEGASVLKIDFFNLFTNFSKYNDTLNQLIKWSPDVVNIQCDAGWFSDSQKIRLGSYFFKTMKAHKIPVIITLHEERKETVSLFKKASAIIFYYQPKYYNELIPNKHFVFDLPACPFSPSCSKSELRKKYNYNDEDFILTTCGTAYREKKIPEIIEAMHLFLKITLYKTSTYHFTSQNKPFLQRRDEQNK